MAMLRRRRLGVRRMSLIGAVVSRTEGRRATGWSAKGS